MSTKAVEFPLQTAIAKDYILVVSNWMRKQTKCSAQSLILLITQWIAASRICSIQNLWRGESETRYGTFWGYNSFSKQSRAVLCTEKQLWKQIPVLYNTHNVQSDENVFYVQNLNSEKYLCFATNGSHWVELYNDKEIVSEKAVKIQCAQFKITKNDERFVYDKDKVNSVFYCRNIENLNHIAFRGVGLSFYDRTNTNDLVPWLVEYTNDAIEVKRINIIQRWLEKLSVTEYFSTFIDAGFDRMELVLEMNDSQLQQIGITKIGHRLLLKRSIDDMRKAAIKQYVNNLNADMFL
eukprot:218170_1